MSKQCIFIALSNQKGGVGKSTMTVLLASYFHYVRGKTVAVMDCDYPQFSIQTLRDRDVSNVEKSEQLQRKLCEQYERVGKKAYPIVTAGADKVLEAAGSLSETCDLIFFDLPGKLSGSTRGHYEYGLCVHSSYTGPDGDAEQSVIRFHHPGFHPPTSSGATERNPLVLEQD